MIKKDTIYLEPDDEITTVIDKLQQSEQPVVALVLPQRASVFQSVVNIKLLKRSATKYKKQIALVTSDPVVMKLAGLSSLHVAKTLQSKPEIPTVDKVLEPEADKAAEDAQPDKAAVAAVGVAALDETIELDNSEPGKPAKANSGKSKLAPKKKIKIPDFGSFRTKLFLGVTLFVLLIVGGIFAFVVMPKATVFITTDTQGLDISANFQLTTAATEFSADKLIVPATLAEVSKTDTEKVAATGEKNVGKTAAGTVTMTARKTGGNPFAVPEAVPAGTGVSTNGKTFITQEATTFTLSGASSCGGSCYQYPATSSTDITAQAQGTTFNTSSGASFTVSSRTDVTASGSASGGTDEVVKVVSAADIETAKERLSGRSKSTAFDELKTSLTSQQLKPIEQTLEEGEPKIQSSVAADAQAADVTVTSTVVYKMLGVKEEYLNQVLDKAVRDRMGEAPQKIQDNGLSTATITVLEKVTAIDQKLQLKTVATVGPEINTESIKQLAAGKKRGEIQDEIRRIDGVKDVRVEYSPFWVLQTPSSPDKIHVVLEQQGQ